MSENIELENCQERVATRARAAQVGERLRLWINAVPVLGAPVAVGFAWLHPLLGSVAVAVLTLSWLVGIYRTEKLCHRTAVRLQDAEQELAQLKAVLAGGQGRTLDYETPAASAAWSHAGARVQSGRAARTPLHHH